MKPIIQLRLFVSGRDKRAARQTVECVTAACGDSHVRSSYRVELEVIDIRESPELADHDQVLVTPTLLRKQPAPVRRLVGDLSTHREIRLAMELEPTAGARIEAGGSKV